MGASKGHPGEGGFMMRAGGWIRGSKSFNGVPSETGGRGVRMRGEF